MANGSSARITAELRQWIEQAPAGARLPSNRELVRRFQASPVTVQSAMRQLIGLGLVESRPGVGTFVRGKRALRSADYSWQTAALGSPSSALVTVSRTQRAAAPGAIALHSGYPAPALLPERLVRTATARAARSAAALARSPTAGLPELQAWFAAQLNGVAGAATGGVTAHDVVITAGSQSGLSSIFRTLVGAGQPLLIESPTYWGAILAARQAGVRLVPVPSGPSGPDPEQIDQALRRSGARAFYAQPNFANPTGAQWSVERGREILDLLRRHGAFLVEDDWAHDLAIDTDPQPVAAFDDQGHVVYLRSLTKSVSPALRVAAVIVRGPARERILADRGAEAIYVSGLVQAAALDVVTHPGWRGHLRSVRRELATCRDALVAAVRSYVPGAAVETVPRGGLGLWLRLPETTDVDDYVRECENRGVVVAPGDEWFPAEPAGPYVRLNFAAEHPGRFDDAARLMGDALRAVG